mmetsp:Transcript_98559/g.220063  ORF Transcript_98559/g.220063 Transcript_98559/m.220063 type:complete len:217 (+) Transcript_98559:304-954(+)
MASIAAMRTQRLPSTRPPASSLRADASPASATLQMASTASRRMVHTSACKHLARPSNTAPSSGSARSDEASMAAATTSSSGSCKQSTSTVPTARSPLLPTRPRLATAAARSATLPRSPAAATNAATAPGSPSSAVAPKASARALRRVPGSCERRLLARAATAACRAARDVATTATIQGAALPADRSRPRRRALASLAAALASASLLVTGSQAMICS